MENALVYVIAALVVVAVVFGVCVWKLSKKIAAQEKTQAEKQKELKSQLTDLEEGVGQQGQKIKNLDAYADQQRAYHAQLAQRMFQKQKRSVRNFIEEFEETTREGLEHAKCAGLPEADIQKCALQLNIVKDGLLNFVKYLPTEKVDAVQEKALQETEKSNI